MYPVSSSRNLKRITFLYRRFPRWQLLDVEQSLQHSGSRFCLLFWGNDWHAENQSFVKARNRSEVMRWPAFGSFSCLAIKQTNKKKSYDIRWFQTSQIRSEILTGHWRRQTTAVLPIRKTANSSDLCIRGYEGDILFLSSSSSSSSTGPLAHKLSKCNTYGFCTRVSDCDPAPFSRAEHRRLCFLSGSKITAT